jgi:hypothetical protein
MAAWIARAAAAAKTAGKDENRPPLEEQQIDDEGSTNSLVARALKRRAEASPQVSPDKARDDGSSDSESEGVPDELPRLGVAKRAGNQNAAGSGADRWSARCHEDQVDAEILRGCTKSCGCVHRHALLVKDTLMQRRRMFAEMGEVERRASLRMFLDDNRSSCSKSGFLLHYGDSTRVACLKGFCVYTGLTEYFVRARMADVLAGQMGDDANLGGARVTGSSGGGDDASDTPLALAVHGWYSALCNEIEPTPNSQLNDASDTPARQVTLGILMS